MNVQEAARKWADMLGPVGFAHFTEGILLALSFPEYARALESGLSGPEGGEDDQATVAMLRLIIESLPIEGER